ncbi:MAG: DUF5662 family protein [Ruminococcus sp.]
MPHRGGSCYGLAFFWGHLSTITRHRHAVSGTAKAGIFWQGLRHDLSKYSPTEFWQGVTIMRTANAAPTKPNVRHGFKWMHHRGQPPPLQYWSDYNENQTGRAGGNAGRFLAEMFCDRGCQQDLSERPLRPDLSLDYFQRSTSKKRGMLHPRPSGS